jgi:hypothetical protein
MLLLAMLLLASARSTRAQGNMRSSPIGGRTTLVGGAGLAYANDGAAAFLNPATIARVDPGRLTFSVNFYALDLWRAPSWYEPGAVDGSRFGDLPESGASLATTSFDALPSSLCLFLKTRDIEAFARGANVELRDRGARLGLCFATVQAREFAFAAENFARSGAGVATRQGQTVTESYTRFSVGPTYAMNIDERLTVGASLHASLASFRSLFASTSTTYGPGPSPVSTSFYGASRGASFQATATVGATWRASRHQTVAFALESPSLHVYGKGGANVATHYEGALDRSSALLAEGSFRSSSPTRIGLGTGIEGTWGNAELDVSAWLPMERAFEAELDGSRVSTANEAVTDVPVRLPVSSRTRGVVNVALGGEVLVSPRLSVLAGLGTDLSAVPRGGITRGEMTYLPVRHDRLYMSFGVGSHGSGGDLLVGTELSYGWGERVAVNSYQLPPALAATTSGTFNALFVVAGSTSLASIQRAVRDVTEVLGPTPQKATPPAAR